MTDEICSRGEHTQLMYTRLTFTRSANSIRTRANPLTGIVTTLRRRHYSGSLDTQCCTSLTTKVTAPRRYSVGTMTAVQLDPPVKELLSKSYPNITPFDDVSAVSKAIFPDIEVSLHSLSNGNMSHTNLSTTRMKEQRLING